MRFLSHERGVGQCRPRLLRRLRLPPLGLLQLSTRLAGSWSSRVGRTSKRLAPQPVRTNSSARTRTHMPPAIPPPPPQHQQSSTSIDSPASHLRARISPLERSPTSSSGRIGRRQPVISAPRVSRWNESVKSSPWFTERGDEEATKKTDGCPLDMKTEKNPSKSLCNVRSTTSTWRGR